MIKKIVTILFLATFLFCSVVRVQNVSAGGGGSWYRVMAIAAAAFRPQQDGFTYDNAGYWLEHTSFGGICPSCEAWYFAPVHLPHHAVITEFTAYIFDSNAAKSGYVDLVEANLATGNVSSWISTLSSPTGTNSYFTAYAESGLTHSVDNENHAYYLRYRTPMEQTTSDRILLGGIKIGYIEFTPSSPSFYSITGADFTPFTETEDYTNSGARFENGSYSITDYQAGIVLPNGAKLDQITFYYYGVAGKTVSANLSRVSLNGNYITVNSLTSATVAGNGSVTSTIFSPDRIDNTQYAYWLYYRFSTEAGTWPIPYGIVIEYTPKYYSTDDAIFSIPAASFVPRKGSNSYQNHGRYLMHYNVGGDTVATGAYMAPFSPPSGSSITSMSFWVGNSPDSSQGQLMLLSISDTFNLSALWSQYTQAAGGWYAVASGDVEGNPLDLLHNAYYLRFNLPSSSESNWVYAVGARGKWEFKSYFPMLAR